MKKNIMTLALVCSLFFLPTKPMDFSYLKAQVGKLMNVLVVVHGSYSLINALREVMSGYNRDKEIVRNLATAALCYILHSNLQTSVAHISEPSKTISLIAGAIAPFAAVGHCPVLPYRS